MSNSKVEVVLGDSRCFCNPEYTRNCEITRVIIFVYFYLKKYSTEVIIPVALAFIILPLVFPCKEHGFGLLFHSLDVLRGTDCQLRADTLV